MSGAFYLTSYCAELTDLYIDKQEIVFYKDINDLVKKCFYYLENDHLREEIAYNGRLRAVKDHQYDKRIKNLINKINKIN